MGSTQFGNFGNFCRDSTLPVCNLLSSSHDQTGGWGGCELTGIPLSGGRRLGNLGSILLCAFAIATAIYLILRSERKKAAVGRRYVTCRDRTKGVGRNDRRGQDGTGSGLKEFQAGVSPVYSYTPANLLPPSVGPLAAPPLPLCRFAFLTLIIGKCNYSSLVIS